MQLSTAIDRLAELKNSTTDPKEIKLHDSLITILTDVQSKDLSPQQLATVEQALDQFDFSIDPTYRKTHFATQKSALLKVLKGQLSLVPSGHYMEMGMALGMSFGVLGLFASGFLALPIGVLLGMIVGRLIDAQVKNQGRMIRTK
jgi:hypothetical protein